MYGILKNLLSSNVNIYSKNIVQLMLHTFIVCTVWFLIVHFFYKRFKKAFRIVCVILSLISIYGILYYTVLGRTSSGEHIFTFSAKFTDEFFREMFMNVLLYIPIGMSMSVLIGTRAVIVLAFTISGTIELWQYCTGSGLAQGTDIIMNTLGTAIGTFPWILCQMMNGQGM